MEKNFKETANALYAKSDMTPHEVDKKILKDHKDEIFRYDDKGRVMGINKEKYLQGLGRVVNSFGDNKFKPASPHPSWFKKPANKKFIQLLAPDGIWEDFDMMVAHKYINEDYHYIYLRQWNDKEGEYITLNSYFLNTMLKGKIKSELNNIVVIMPPERHMKKLTDYIEFKGE